jgi:hypothetical protein|tara:strand:- start:657 stop:872 length:216 start_codon:yes stop_codon:yes gene_type:complete
MEENKKTIKINGTDYTEDQLTDEQKQMVNHIADLDRKIGSTAFNLDQLRVGRDAFVKLLTEAVEKPPEKDN